MPSPPQYVERISCSPARTKDYRRLFADQVLGLLPPAQQVGKNALVRSAYNPKAPKREDYNEDYCRYLIDYPEEEEENVHLSSINENEPIYQLEGLGYYPQAPSSRATDSDTREWFHFHEDLALSAHDVSPPGTPESVGSSLQSTTNTKKAKGKGKSK